MGACWWKGAILSLGFLLSFLGSGGRDPWVTLKPSKRREPGRLIA